METVAAKKRVLFVDDEPNVLAGLRTRLHRYRSRWEMVFCQSGEEALQACAKEPFDVVVSDLRMPRMNGAELLRQIREKYPDTVRIVLSGEAEVQVGLRVAAEAHQFLAKPCDPSVLERAIERSCALQAELSDPALRQIVGRTDSLPSAPATYAAVTEALKDPRCSLEDIAKVIGADVGMSAMLLKLVNSAFFALPQPTSSIERAVGILGVETLRSLALGMGAFECFRCQQALGHCSIERLMAHSLAVGRLSKCMLNDPRQQEDAFTAGMLHDVGKLVLGARAPERLRSVFERAMQERLPMYMAEQQVSGVDHGMIGAYLLGLWNLPLSIVEAIANHHRPVWQAGQALDLALAVHLADVLIHESSPQSPDGCDQSLFFPDPRMVRELRLEESLPKWRALAGELSGAEVENP